MTRKTWMLIGLALTLAVVYAVFFAHWVKPGTINIYHVTRPSGYAMQTRRNGPAPPITFNLQGDYNLTEIKAVSLAAWQANPNAQPVWHLVADSGTGPVNTFIYGQTIRGLKPAVPGAQPQPLQPDVVYRLFVTAGKFRGQHDFKISGSAPETK
jgi:hypothetical protein